MDWPFAIERHRQALLTIVASIVALLGGRDAAVPIARRLRLAALVLLRPAESAVRRLIVVAAEGLSRSGRAAPSRPPRPFPLSLASAAAGGAGRAPAFRLFDRPKRFGRALRVAPRGEPRIRSFWSGPLLPQPTISPPATPHSTSRPDPDAPVESCGLRLRLAALEFALADIPRQARRLVRRLDRQTARQAPRGARRAPLRIGRPPGWRRDATRGVDVALRECHGLAMQALRADTS